MNEAKTNLTLKQRRRLQGDAQPSAKQQGDGSRKELPLIAAILILLFAFGGGTALGMILFRTDPQMQEAEDVEAILANQLTPSDVRGELGGVAADLPGNIGRRMRMRDPEEREMAMAPKFLAKSSADQLAAMQKMVDWEKEREADREAREAAAATKPADTSQANNNGNGSGRGGKTDEQRIQSMQQHLANRPPEQRAQGTLFHQMMNSVRQQNGLGAR